jgi:hypothetical protein
MSAIWGGGVPYTARLHAECIVAQTRLWENLGQDRAFPRECVTSQVAELAALLGYRLEPISTTSLPVTTGILPGTTVGAPHD